MSSRTHELKMPYGQRLKTLTSRSSAVWVKPMFTHKEKLARCHRRALWQYTSRTIKMSIPFNSATCLGGTYAKERILQKERDVLKDRHRHRAKT